MDTFSLAIGLFSGFAIGIIFMGYSTWLLGGQQNYINRKWVDRKENPLEKKLDDFADKAGMERLSTEEKIEAARRYLLSTK